jgi:plastocyanin
MSSEETPMDDSAPTQTGDAPAQPSPTGMPRWVKISLIVVVVLIGLFIVMHFAGMRMGHGPGRHMGGGDHEASRVAEGAKRIPVRADGFKFDPDEITVAAGEDVAVEFTSVDVVHDFVIDELEAHVSAEPGETASGGFRADEPGRYTFYCTEPGHRAEGMEGTLTVTGRSNGSDHEPPAGVDHG